MPKKITSVCLFNHWSISWQPLGIATVDLSNYVTINWFNTVKVQIFTVLWNAFLDVKFSSQSKVYIAKVYIIQQQNKSTLKILKELKTWLSRAKYNGNDNNNDSNDYNNNNIKN